MLLPACLLKPTRQCNFLNRIIKQGRFDWGSFSAFEDGSIELERAGVKQWFRNFSELERSLNYRGRE